MFPQQTHDAQTDCKCCGARSSLFAVCDFSKNCDEVRGTYLPLSGIPVYYYRCESCGFIFTRQFDQASHDEMKRYVYNDAYLRVDPDSAAVRPRANAESLASYVGDYKHSISVLDYGCGNGGCAARLAELGFADVGSYDPFYARFAARPQRRFNLIVAFEVVEHVPTPLETFADMLSFLDERRGMALFTTLLSPPEVNMMKAGWWYIAPRNGHVSIHSRESLATVFRRLGVQVVSVGDAAHFAYRHLPDFGEHLLKAVAPGADRPS